MTTITSAIHREDLQMLKKIKFLFITGIILTMINISTFASENITVMLNGEQLSFDVSPKVINGRTMVPMRTIFEKLGATVEWDEETQTITSVKGDTTIKLTIGVPNIKINQQTPKELDTAPCIAEGRTLVPVRAISEDFHMNVDWDDSTQTVLITPPNVNITAYNKMKSIILTQGEKPSGIDTYSIYYSPEGKTYSVMFLYSPESEYIILYFHWENKIDNTVMITIYPDRNPSVYHTEKFSTGNEYTLYAKYPKANQPFVETENTFPPELSPYEFLNVSMALTDVYMKKLVNMSFADFWFVLRRTTITNTKE